MTTTVQKQKIMRIRMVRASYLGYDENMKMTKVKKLELERLAQRVVDSTTKTIRAIDKTLAYCEASNARMGELPAWMRKRGYD